MPYWNQSIQHPLLSLHLPSMRIEDYSVGQARLLLLLKSMFAILSNFLFHLLGDDIQNELFNHFSRNGGKADRPVAMIILLALFEFACYHLLPQKVLAKHFFSISNWVTRAPAWYFHLLLSHSLSKVFFFPTCQLQTDGSVLNSVESTLQPTDYS